MPDTKLSAITNISAPALTDLVYGEQGGTEFSYPLARMLAVAARSTVGGRLSVQTNVAVPTTDQAAQSTLYYTPYLHKDLGLYDGTRWQIVSPAQLSLALTGLTTGKNYDAFVDWNAGSPSLVLGPAWTSDTARATALTTQDGINVLTGTLTSRYMGTIRATAATTTEDTLIQRYVWNAYNQVPRKLYKIDSTSHTYNSATARQWNATAADKVEFVLGLAGQGIPAGVLADLAPASPPSLALVSINLDSITALGAASPFLRDPGGSSGSRGQIGISDVFIPAVGYHYIALLEAELSNAVSSFNAASVVATILG